MPRFTKILARLTVLVGLFLYLCGCTTNAPAEIFASTPNNQPPTGDPFDPPDTGDPNPNPNPDPPDDPVIPIAINLFGRLAGDLSFSTGSITVPHNSNIDLTWTVSGDPESCSFNNISVNPLSTSAENVSGLTATTIYSLSCTKGGATETDSLTVNVLPAAPPPITVDLKIRPSGFGLFIDGPIVITEGDGIDLQWSFTGEPDSCSIAGVTNDAKSTLQESISNLTQNGSYTLECVRGNETETDTVSFTVSPAPVTELSITNAGAHDFGSIDVYQTASKTFTVTNSGDTSVTGINVVGVTSPFSLVSSNCTSLTPLASCSYTVRFSPVFGGTFSDTASLVFSSNGQSDNMVLQFSGGTNVPPAPHGLDNTFGNNGNITNTSIFGADGAFIQYDAGLEKLILWGRKFKLNQSGFAMGFVRMNPNGSIDNTFGQNGIVTTENPDGNSDHEAKGVILRSDGRFVASNLGFGLHGYTADGAVDNTFGTNGYIDHDYNGGASFIDMAPAPGDKIVIVAKNPNVENGPFVIVGTGIHLMRLNANGSLDNTFGVGGKISHEVAVGGTVNFPTKVMVQPDGKIVVGAYVDCNGAWNTAVLRFNVNGSRDTTFGSNGMVCTHTNPSVSGVTNLFYLPNGNLVAIAVQGANSYLDHISSTGTVLKSTALGDIDQTQASMAPNGNILFGVRHDSNDVSAAKLITPSGSILKTYARAGFTPTYVEGVLLQADDKVIVYGQNKGGSVNTRAARFLP